MSEPDGLTFLEYAHMASFVIAILGYLGGGAYLLWSHGENVLWVVVICGAILPMPFALPMFYMAFKAKVGG